MGKTVREMMIQKASTKEGVHSMVVSEYKMQYFTNKKEVERLRDLGHEFEKEKITLANGDVIERDVYPTILKSVLSGTLETGKKINIINDVCKYKSKDGKVEYNSFTDSMITDIAIQLGLFEIAECESDEVSVWNPALTGSTLITFCVHNRDKVSQKTYENFYFSEDSTDVKAMLAQQALLAK